MKKPIEPEKTLHQALSGIESLTSPQSEPKQPISEDEFGPACHFVTQLVSQAHQYGASFIRLQDFMSQLPHLFGLQGAMLAASPFFFFEFWRRADPQPSRVTLRLPVGSFDLSKLSQLGILVNDLTDGKVTIEDAEQLWGLDTWTAEQEICKLQSANINSGKGQGWRKLGEHYTTQRPSIVAIGPAGENICRIGSLIHGGGSSAGQGGFGGVFGSKKLKAIKRLKRLQGES